MNEHERIKLEKDGLDVIEDIKRYASQGYEAITEDDFTRMRWYGLYQQKPNVGHFMLRIKVPGGILTSQQLRTAAEVSRLYGRGIVDITTRQNFQFHWLEVQNLPDILSRFLEVGISTQGACGDIPRNVTGCPVAGLDPDELIDCTDLVGQIHTYFTGNRAFSNLPRKYKLSISGCRNHCSQPEINDVGATAALRTHSNGNSEVGFHIRVGGGLSARPMIAKKLNMFVSPDQVIDVFAAVTEIFREHGNRENRKKARLKFLVDEWGVERFEDELRGRLSFKPDSASDWPDPLKASRDHVGAHPQKQPGLNWIGVSVLTGRLTDSQVLAAAEIADEFGNGTVRTTNQQNLLFVNIPDANLAGAQAALKSAGFISNPSPFRRSSIACTGTEFCNLAITETKRLMHEIITHLEETVLLDEPIRINLNGCPNSCGQHHIGDIGLQGCLVKSPTGVSEEAFDISLGGRLGSNAKLVRPIWRRVSAKEVKFAIENLLQYYADNREIEDDFSDFVDRYSNEDLASFMKSPLEVAG